MRLQKTDGGTSIIDIDSPCNECRNGKVLAISIYSKVRDLLCRAVQTSTVGTGHLAHNNSASHVANQVINRKPRVNEAPRPLPEHTPPKKNLSNSLEEPT